MFDDSGVFESEPYMKLYLTIRTYDLGSKGRVLQL